MMFGRSLTAATKGITPAPAPAPAPSTASCNYRDTVEHLRGSRKFLRDAGASPGLLRLRDLPSPLSVLSRAQMASWIRPLGRSQLVHRSLFLAILWMSRRRSLTCAARGDFG